MMNEQNNVYVSLNGDFAVDICGDVLVNFGILNGDIITIKQQPDVLSGALSLVEYDGALMITKIHQDFDKDVLILQSGNPKYPPIILEGEDKERVTVIGKAISIIRNIGECEDDNEN